MADGIYYDSAAMFIDSRQSMRDKVRAIDAIIDSLILLATTAADNPSGQAVIEEYSLDDGQTRIRTKYRTVQDIITSIDKFERIRQMYINRLTGRMIRLVDSRNNIGNR
jgi:hypothetical protein